MCSSHGVLCLHIRRFLCYTAKSSKVVSYSFAVATYPREGTETESAAVHEAHPGLQLIPARGRKLLIFAFTISGAGCNLSPRGDGNPSRRTIGWTTGSCNLSPRGDGNDDPAFLKLAHARCNLSPRGDGNLMGSLYTTLYTLQLIPARGRKHPTRMVVDKLLRCSLSPRGDGNSPATPRLRVLNRCNLSPRGDGNSLLGGSSG